MGVPGRIGEHVSPGIERIAELKVGFVPLRVVDARLGLVGDVAEIRPQGGVDLAPNRACPAREGPRVGGVVARRAPEGVVLGKSPCLAFQRRLVSDAGQGDRPGDNSSKR